MRAIIKNFIILFLLISTLYSEGFGNFGTFNQGIKKEFLSPKEAFKVEAKEDKDSIKIDIKLGKNIHIYKKDLKVLLTKPIKKDITPPLPKGKIYDNQEVYYDKLTLKIPKKEIIKYSNSEPFSLSVTFSGCSDDGICYQPQKFDFSFKALKEKGFFEKISSLAKSGNSQKIVKALQNEGILFILTLFFFVGVLLSFTPCILPMVPILSSIIIQQAGGKEISRGKSFFISLVYVVSMSFTYALIGVVAGLLNFDIQANMNNPFIIIPIALIFVALALSLFGYFDLALPASWQNKLNKISSKGEGKGVIGTAIMGAISALIVGTCTAPVISGAILFISMSGNALLGGISLFVMGMGAGLPLLLVGAGAKNLVPKPGGWMVRVSQTFGILMLAMAIYIIRGVIPQELYMILIASLLVGVALFIGIFEKRSGFKILLSIFAYFLLILGTIEFIGALAGAKSSLRPLEPFTSSKVIKKEEVIVDEAKGYTLEKLLEEVKNAKKPVIVDIGKENCAACSELATITFPNKDVQKAMKRFKFIKIDITKNSKDDQKILKHFKLFGAPNIIFFDSNGTYLNEKSLTGFIKPKDFIEHIKDIK